MTTTVSPALGQGAVMNQATSYDAISARRFWGVGYQEGAITAGSYEVVQRAAGANMSVDIAATTGDGALVQGDAVTAQGLYHVPPHTAVINEVVTAAHATLPRIDMVVLEVKDNQHDASGSNLAQTRVVAGTPTGGATLGNRTGAAALPSSALLLADVLVGAAVSTITNAVIRDRRKWARGAFVRLVRTAGDLTTATASMTQLNSALQARVECSGVPVKLGIYGKWLHSVATELGKLQPTIDGAGIDGTTEFAATHFPTGGVQFVTAEYTFTPAAGSHLLEWYWATPNATLTFKAAAATPIVVVIEEIVRQNTPNNVTTTG